MKDPVDFTRRRFIRLALAAGGLALGAPWAKSFARSLEPRLHEWSGIVFGTFTSIQFYARNDREAHSLSGQCGEEVRRLESIFSLFQENSDLRRLNRDGVLENPPVELVELLEIARAVSELTNGAFDVTVQPLWRAYSEHFRMRPNDTGGPPQGDLIRARELVDFRKVRVGRDRIAFERQGMAVTLNSIAQGYLTDQLTNFLRNRGVESCLVHLGEHRAMGTHPDGEPWRIGIASPDGQGDLLEVVELRDRALATSGGYGYVFDTESLFHHLFNLQGGNFQPSRRTISVDAPTATWADALATAGGVMSDEDFARLKAKRPEVGVRIHRG